MQHLKDLLSKIETANAKALEHLPNLTAAMTVVFDANHRQFERQLLNATYAIGAVASELITADSLLKSFKSQIETVMETAQVMDLDETMVMAGASALSDYNILYDRMQGMVTKFQSRVELRRFIAMSRTDTELASPPSTAVELRVVDDTTEGDVTTISFSDGSTVAAKEQRTNDQVPFFLVPVDTAPEQITAIQQWSRLEATVNHTA